MKIKVRAQEDRKLSPETNEIIGKFIFGIFYPVSFILFILVQSISQGWNTLNILFIFFGSVGWFIFAYRFIFSSESYKFVFDKIPIGITSENNKHHQRFYSDTQKNKSAEKFLKNYYTKQERLKYAGIASFGTFPFIFLLFWISKIFRFTDTTIGICFIFIVGIAFGIYIHKRIEFKKHYILDVKKFLFLSHTAQSYSINNIGDTYFIFRKQNIYKK